MTPLSHVISPMSHPPSLERLARLKLVAQYFKAGRAAEVFLQTADLNRRPPPAMPDALSVRSSPPPLAAPSPPASPGGGGSLRLSGSSHRERDGHPRPAGIAVDPDLSPVGGQEPAHHEQPQAGPPPVRGLLGGEEGFEDPG